MSPRAARSRRMRHLQSLRKRKGPKPAQTYEEVIADPRWRRAVREIQKEFREVPLSTSH